jgi:hypothetical protein
MVWVYFFVCTKVTGGGGKKDSKREDLYIPNEKAPSLRDGGGCASRLGGSLQSLRVHLPSEEGKGIF